MNAGIFMVHDANLAEELLYFYKKIFCLLLPGAVVLIAPPILAYDRECSHFEMAAELNRASMQSAPQQPFGQ